VTELQWLIGLAVFSLLAAAALLLHGGSGEERLAKGRQRLNSALIRLESPTEFVPQGPAKAWVPPLFDSYLQRAGLLPCRQLYVLLALPAVLIFVLGAALFGWLAGLFGLLLLYPLLLGVFLSWRVERFGRQVVEQLPGFLDAISRILTVGCSLELAFRNACEDCAEPLRSIVQLILLRTRAGLALEDAMNQVAELYAIRQLNFVASVFYLGVRYGGNAHAVLERLAQGMREQQRGAKELHAMTAETRASAWVLCALPLFVGGMTLFSNPAYLLGMWRDPMGQRLLLTAAALQVVGMALLFRMARMK